MEIGVQTVAGAGAELVTSGSPRLALPPPIERLVGDVSTDWRPPDRVPDEAAADLRALVVRFEQATHDVDPKTLAVVIGRLLMHYRPPPDRSPELHRLVFEDWLDDLAEYPTAVVAEAADQWRRNERWAPTIAELRGICDAIMARRERQLRRLRFLAACLDRHGGAVPRLYERIGGRDVDTGERATDAMLDAFLRGDHELGEYVWAVPTPRPAPAPQPAPQRHAEPPPPDQGGERRQRVLRLLLAGGVPVSEIEAGNLLDLDTDQARRFVERRRASATPEARS